jgi:hypothetical protein
MSTIRKQLTLFISDQNKMIEKVRATFNPVQHQLIAAHVTLCREDEIQPLATVLRNLQTIILNEPIRIDFEPIERFEHGKGLLMPAKTDNKAFHELRKMVLKDVIELPRIHLPHVTLIHPRNATCTDELFDQIKQYQFPTELYFNQISLIEQKNDGKWLVIEQFPIT